TDEISTLSLHDALPISRTNSDFWGGDIPWMTVKDFTTFDPNETQEYITIEGLKNSATRIVPAGSLIIATRIALGKIVRYQVDVADRKSTRLNSSHVKIS